MEDINLTSSLSKAKALRKTIKEEHGADIGRCYQCGKCTAGCPLAWAMDNSPREIINLLRSGLYEEAIKSNSIWICSTCDTCSTRCPRKVYPSRVMEGLRMEAKRQGIIGEKPLDVFHSAFLQIVERYGRIHELELMLRYNLFTGKLLKDALYAPVMLGKGKLAILPHRIENRDEMKQIFARCRELGGEQQ